MVLFNFYYICLSCMVMLGAASYNTTSVADARSNSTVKSLVVQQQIKRDTKSSNINIAAIAVPPAEAGSPSRLSLNTHSSQSNTASQNIRHETYKALLGETVRLECPQPNPTWFFRQSRHQKQNGDSSSSSPTTNNKNNDNVEDLIVTRHGIINADYKYKIMCHVTLKHQVIIINNIDFDEEGLYTCLYTQSPPPSSLLSNSFNLGDGDNENNDQDYNGESRSSNSMPTQYRYVFNVTVYTLISGLSMNLKPILMKPQSLLQDALNKKLGLSDSHHQEHNDQYEIVESSLTVRENEEFFINCNVESSRPAADVSFTIALNSGGGGGGGGSGNGAASSSSLITPLSIVSSFTSTIKNADQTFRTVQTTRIKANQEDHGKVIACKAENGFSSQKWENKKLLNVLFAPVCKDPPKFVYYIGINQTLNVECRILNANPNQVTYEWNLDGINHGIKSTMSSSSSILHQQYFNTNNNNKYGEVNYDHQEENSVITSSSLDNVFMPLQSDKNLIGLKKTNENKAKLETDIASLPSAASIDANIRFKWRPSSLRDFGIVKCKATNEIGSTECSYELKLGGVPNPPTDCTHVLKNTSAIISCQVGFHQGDPDIYCYLLRKTDTGIYKEHTRNRESCSFIVNDVNVNKLNEFWIYSSNKHGHNKDVGVYLTIGQMLKLPEPLTSNKSFMVIVGAVGLIIFLFLACCFCVKLRKGLSDDTDDSVLESEAYHVRGPNGFISGKKLLSHASSSGGGGGANSSFSNKMIKGVKIGNQEKSKSFDSSDSSSLTKRHHPHFQTPQISSQQKIGNGAFTYTEPYSYTTIDQQQQQQQQKSDTSYNEELSLAKKLEVEEEEVEYEKKNSKKKSKFSLFKRKETKNKKGISTPVSLPFKKELITSNTNNNHRHVYNFSTNHHPYSSSLQRNHHHNHHYHQHSTSKTRLDGLEKLKKSNSFTKNHEDSSGDTSTSPTSASANTFSSSTKSLKESQLEPLVLNNNSSLVNSNGLLTTLPSKNKNHTQSQKHMVSSLTTSSSSHSNLPSQSSSSSFNSLNESPAALSNKMSTFFSSINNNNSGTNGRQNQNNNNNNKNANGFNVNIHLTGQSLKRTTGSGTNKFLNSSTKPSNHSITTLNINNSTNTTVTTAASSSSSSSSGGTSTSSPTTSSANQDEDDDDDNNEYHNSTSKKTTSQQPQSHALPPIPPAHKLTVSDDQSFGHTILLSRTTNIISSKQQQPLTAPTSALLMRTANMSTFSSTRQTQNEPPQLTYVTPRCFISSASKNHSNNNKTSSLLSPLPPPPPPQTAPLSLLESSGSFSTTGLLSATASFSAANDRISDSLDAKFLNKLCEEIEVSLNVDCECADDYDSSNDINSGDYSFDHELLKLHQHQPIPTPPQHINNKYTPYPTSTTTTTTTQMKNYLQGNLKSTNGGMFQKSIHHQQQQQPAQAQHQQQQKPKDVPKESQNSGKNPLGVLV